MRLFIVITSVVVFCSINAYAYMSPDQMIASEDGRLLFVTAATGKSILVFDTEKNSVVKQYALPENPSGIALSKDGNVLFVTVGIADGELLLLDTATGKLSKRIAVGHSPMAPTLTSDSKIAYIANRYPDKVTKVDVEQGKVIATVDAVREPVSLALNPDETSLFVANHLPAGRADADRIASSITVIETSSFRKKKDIQLVNGTISLRTMHLSRDGKWLFVPSYIARFSVPTNQLERGWMNTAAMSIIDVSSESLFHAFLMDDVDLGAPNPRGVTTTPDNTYLCVSHNSSHEVSLIDLKRLFERLSMCKPAYSFPKIDAYETATNTPANRLDMMVDIRQRVPIKGNAPRGIVASGDRVWTANYYSDDITYFSIKDPSKVTVTPVQAPQPLTDVRKGEMYFNDASYCYQKWQSCSCCHPDARTDAVNWDLLNDGIGNPKNTKSMIFAHRTPPVMITGIRPNAETAVRAGINYIMFAQVDEGRARAIDEYLKSLEPVPSPYLVNGKLSNAAKRGKAAFEKASCDTCHSGEFYTDLKQYDVGTAVSGQDKGRKFDTPTLREVWRTAPYLFDGRAATLKEVFTTFNKGDYHGMTSILTEKEIDDLVDYIKSL